MIGVINKGPRFAKILGDYGEHLVLAQLARSGFVVSHADQVGPDVIAYNPSTKRRLGITVKSLTRIRSTESHSVIFDRGSLSPRGTDWKTIEI